MYRLVICVDVEADSLEEAYEKTFHEMGSISSPDFEWESSDEAYDADGEEIPEEEFQAARMSVYEKLRREGKLD